MKTSKKNTAKNNAALMALYSPLMALAICNISYASILDQRLGEGQPSAISSATRIADNVKLKAQEIATEKEAQELADSIVANAQESATEKEAKGLADSIVANAQEIATEKEAKGLADSIVANAQENAAEKEAKGLADSIVANAQENATEKEAQELADSIVAKAQESATENQASKIAQKVVQKSEEVSEPSSSFEMIICEQRDTIAKLEKEIAALKDDTLSYEPLLSSMNQIMMMNLMMQNQKQSAPFSYMPNNIDMASSMLAPMMMMQSMAMGMQIRSMSELYHNSKVSNYVQQTPQPHAQSVYNIGGDYYGRDYNQTHTLSPMVQQPFTQETSPFSFDFDERAPKRAPSFENITPEPQRPELNEMV